MPSPHNINGEAVVGSAIPYKASSLENSMNSTTPSAATIHINTTSNDTHNTSTTSSAPNEQFQNSSNVNNQQNNNYNNIIPQQEVTTTTTTSLTTKQALKSSVLMTTTTAVVVNGANNVAPTINTHTSVSSSSTSINPASSTMKHHQQHSTSNNARPRTHSNPHAFSYRTSHHQQHYGTNSRDSFFSNLLSSISTDSNGSSRKKEFKQSITLLRNFIVRSRNAIFLVLLLLCVIASLLFVYNLRSGVFTKIQNTITTSVDDGMDSLEEATTIYDHSTYDGSLIANRHHQEPVSKSTWESLQSSDPRTEKLVMNVEEQPQEKKKKNKKKVIQQTQPQKEEEPIPSTQPTTPEENPKLMMENSKATKTTTSIQPEGGDKPLSPTDIKPLPYIKPLNHHDIPLPTRKPTPQEENEINKDFKIDHIYVINLKIREDRRLKSIRRLNTLGGIFSNYTFFEPVYGESLTDQDIFNHVSITTYKAILEGRSLDYQLSTKGGVGCYLTHTNIWKDMIEKGYERILIFEDDFEITSPYEEIMTYFSHLPKNFDVAFMYFSLFPGSGDFERYNDYWMTTTATRVYGAASYIINRSAAEKLLEKAFPIDLQLDAFINHYVTFTGGLRLYSSKLLFGHEITELFKTNVQDYCWKCIANNLMDNFLSVDLVFNVFLIMSAVIVALILYFKFFSKMLARKRGKQDRLAEWSHDE